MYQWRRFPFFEKELVTENDSAQALEADDGATPSQTPKGAAREALKVFKQFNPTCATSGRGKLVFGDDKGVIRIISRDFECLPFQAYETSVSCIQQLKRSNMLVSVGNDAMDNTIIKFWNLGSGADSSPQSTRSIPIFANTKVARAAVTALAVLEDMSQVAVGLENGTTLFYDAGSSSLLRGRVPKPRLLSQENTTRVTGLLFREADVRTNLFVLTENSLSSHFTKFASLRSIQIDTDGGAAPNCSVLNNENTLVAGRDNAVYFYEPEEKGICFGFEGKKRRLGWFNTYLWVVTEEKPGLDMLTVYDLRNKFIAFAGKFKDIVSVVCEWGDIFVVTAQQVAYQLHEKDLAAKMAFLFSRNCYPIAISLASSQGVEEAYVKEIHQTFGDHLYAKGDYDGAIQQYLETVTHIEPSYVIRKFLDAQRIHNLTRYLQVLHEKGRANKDHTTLLLNCYTKLKDTKRLDQFVTTDTIDFDVETAIKVLRQAGYWDHALYLADRHRNADLFLQIMMHDTNNPAGALEFIGTLPFEEARRYLKTFGKRLVDARAKEASSLLQKICTSYLPAARVPFRMPGAEEKADLYGGQTDAGTAGGNATAQRADADDFIHLFVNEPAHLTKFLATVVARVPKHCSTLVYNTLLELYLREGMAAVEQAEEAKARSGLAAAKAEALELANPNSDLIMALLKNSDSQYDENHALVLCKMYDFERGVTFLYEKLQLYHEILTHHMERHSYSKIIKTCQKYGDQNSQLWVQALSYFAFQDEECSREIETVLDEIDNLRLLPPLMVVQMLSRNPTKTLAVIKDYIIKTLRQEDALTTADQAEIQQHQKETQRMRDEMTELTSGATAFQNTTCTACNQPLDLPAVHFLCMHSFHDRCLGDPGEECLKCAQEYRQLLEMKQSMEQSASDHDGFFKQLDDAKDGFTTVAEFFGRGIFNKSSSVESGGAAGGLAGPSAGIGVAPDL